MRTHPLKIYRQINKLSLDDLSKKIELTAASLSRIENNLQGMTLKTAKKLEDVSGIPQFSWLWPDKFPHPIFENYKEVSCS
jgi:transcriptional regulator with XRE-family HTH domain